MPSVSVLARAKSTGKVRPSSPRNKNGTLKRTGICANGHRRTERNTYDNPVTGKRYCRTCHNLARQQARARNAEARSEERAEGRLKRRIAEADIAQRQGGVA